MGLRLVNRLESRCFAAGEQIQDKALMMQREIAIKKS
jgi:hypothetical protein